MQGAVLSGLNTGIGLRHPHYQAILDTRPSVGWLEVHSENYFGKGGLSLHYLEKLRQNYPISFHGVGLSLGSSDALDIQHLQQIKQLLKRFDPFLISEHLSWSSIQHTYVPDLLPLPFTHEALDTFCEKLSKAQEFLDRRLLIENPSSYLAFKNNEMTECEFLSMLVKRTGCGLLLDVNNAYVSSSNLEFNAHEYFEHLPFQAIQEIHLGGYSVHTIKDTTVLIDTHNAPVHPPVWQLFKTYAQYFSHVPTLIEWDIDIPELSVLVAEAHKADQLRTHLPSNVPSLA